MPVNSSRSVKERTAAAQAWSLESVYPSVRSHSPGKGKGKNSARPVHSDDFYERMQQALQLCAASPQPLHIFAAEHLLRKARRLLHSIGEDGMG